MNRQFKTGKNQMSTSFPPIEEVEEVGPKDNECLDEIRAVLEKHDALNRFGVTLLHSHFPVAEGETLLESCDLRTRTLVISPVSSRKVAEKQFIQTHWHLRAKGRPQGQPLMSCLQGCAREEKTGNHASYHAKA